MLDAHEYLHLAIDASQKGDHHAALNYLDHGLASEPDSAALIYFRAAEHAELGLFERACTGITRALEIDGRLEIARFQLGLLHLKLQRPDSARASFSSLASFSQDKSLGCFAQACIHMLDDDPASARRLLAAGLTECSNAALKADMTRILADLDEEASSAEGSHDAESVFLGAYLNANEHAP